MFRSRFLAGSPAASKSTKICAVRSASEILQSSMVGAAEGVDVKFEEGNWVEVEVYVKEFSKKSSSSSVTLENVGLNDGDTVEFSEEISLNSNVASSEELSVATKVGSSDGSSLGAVEGYSEGPSLGALDRFREGPSLGAVEG